MRRLIDLTDEDLRALLDERLAEIVAELRGEPVPELVDRDGLAKALSCSTRTLDRLRAEPGFPELQLVDLPRFCVADVVAWIRARGAGSGLRVVGGGK
jgi:hypothetical protein